MIYGDIKLKAINEQIIQTKSQIQQQYSGYKMGKGQGEVEESKRSQI